MYLLLLSVLLSTLCYASSEIQQHWQELSDLHKNIVYKNLAKNKDYCYVGKNIEFVVCKYSNSTHEELVRYNIYRHVKNLYPEEQDDDIKKPIRIPPQYFLQEIIINPTHTYHTPIQQLYIAIHPAGANRS